MMAKQTRYTITLIGPGKVGTALSHVLKANGHHVAMVIGRTAASARKGATLVGAQGYSSTLSALPASTNLILICAPGSAIGEIAANLALSNSIRWSRTLVIHTSGGEGAELLEPLALEGARTAAIHPIQTFPEFYPPEGSEKLLRGISFGVDADRRSLASARRFVDEFQGTIIHVPGNVRPLYHAMCVFASGYIVELLSVIERISEELPGRPDWRAAVGPLAARSFQNAFHSVPSDSLTGPLIRGDAAAIARHIEALSRLAPPAADLYRALAHATLADLRSQRRLPKSVLTSLTNALKPHPATSRRKRGNGNKNRR